MSIITLTTDMGIEDYYVAAVKGAIYRNLPDVRVIDVSHVVSPFKISQAAYLVKHCMDEFPDETVHIIGVDAEPLINFSNPDLSVFPTIVKYKNQYLVGADNGVFSLILGNNQPQEVWRMEDVLSRPDLMNFPTKNILVPAACKIISGVDFESFASSVDGIKRVTALSPVLDGNTLKGVVTYVDHYGNAITNINKEDFERVGKSVPFTIYFRRKEYFIDTISNGYNEVPEGEKVALFNDSGHLEIAINKGTPENGGGAGSLLGLRVNEMVRVEFTPRGSHSTIESLF